MIRQYLLTAALIFCAAITLVGQKTIKLPDGTPMTIIKKGTICYGSDVDVHGFNPAPVVKDFGKSGNTEDAEFIVEYRGFPSTHQAAIDRALEIVSSLFKSPVPIYVDADYQDLSNDSPGALAGAFFNINATNLNFNNVPHFNVWYPIPLIEKLVGFQLTGPTDADIEITVNSDANWFTDFNNPGNITSGQFDLVTVILHELFHGLGFAGFATVDENTGNGILLAGAVSGDDFPFVFDYYVENSGGDRIVSTIQDNSTAAANFLQGG
ncbi:MAG: hypothetical protein KJP00_10755, partial [Bacteroidia bacterium]|nr:hypothetical protein [Bacteroidia bacterium]